MKRFQRPEADFEVLSVTMLIDIRDRHADAGFDAIKDEQLKDWFWVLIDFLQGNDLSNGTAFKERKEIDQKTKLMNSNLNDDGYYFLQKFTDRHMKRLYIDRNQPERSRKFLKKWLEQYKKEVEPGGGHNSGSSAASIVTP